ncbi:hypothetical protein GCM10009827_017660 [Dactylosporangium maewongense]|uniref:Uncharacterized protein n=1 Tax=Dactylosporangium maewongense TaxID=634393 RepID=A0ABN1ZU92_9ACTN
MLDKAERTLIPAVVLFKSTSAGPAPCGGIAAGVPGAPAMQTLVNAPEYSFSRIDVARSTPISEIELGVDRATSMEQKPQSGALTNVCQGSVASSRARAWTACAVKA